MGLDRARTERQRAVRRPQPAAGRRTQRRRPRVPPLRRAPLRPVVLQARQRRLAPHPHAALRGARATTLARLRLHTCAAGSLGMLAIGVGGLDVAMAIAGEPLTLRMPEIWGVQLTGELPDWVSAKDVILEMLRRHGVKGGVQPDHRVPRPGPGTSHRDGPARHRQHGRRAGRDHHRVPGRRRGARASCAPRAARTTSRELSADPDAAYDVTDEIDLSTLEPLIARPSSPGNVVPVREVAGEPVARSSSAPRPTPACATSPSPPRWSTAARPTTRSASTSTRPRGRSSQDLTRMGATVRADRRRAPASTRPAAWAASAWARRRPPGATRCAPSRATSPAARARRRTRSGCAPRRPRRPPR